MQERYTLPFLEGKLDSSGEREDLCGSPPLGYSVRLDSGLKFSGFRTGKGKLQFSFERDLPITAIQEGRVIKTNRTDHKKDVGHKKAHNTNYLVIEGNDKVRVRYTHVISDLENGDLIEQGQEIGRLGGYRGHPHLHLDFYKQRGLLLPKKQIDVCPDEIIDIILLF